ncbi:MAG TPA: TROVE domain-containing protein [Polyangiaceae bacterium]|nr:TROVE domain-containing protein [Polyangiaceae bacterium]
MKYASHFSTLQTPQTEKAAPNQVQNNAGGFSFQITPQQQLERWLVLGSEGGTYYVTEKKLTRDNAKTVIACLDADGPGTVSMIASFSESGRAPKNDPAIFALAIASGHSDSATRKAALDALPRVCRTGTHLFQFASVVKNFRGWGRGLRSAVGRWYSEKSPDQLAYQIAKYQQREGWSHRDLMRLAHPGPKHAAIYRYIVTGAGALGDREVKRGERVSSYAGVGELPPFLAAVEEAKQADEHRTILLIREHGLTHEMVNSEHLRSPDVWEALLERMPLTAMLRSLARMTNIGLLKPLSNAATKVGDTVSNEARLKKARVHPIQVLSALMTYKQGHGMRGSLTWSPAPQIVDALDAGFYAAFGAIEPSGARTLLGIDVSGSMGGSKLVGIDGLTARHGAAVMAMVTARVEKQWHILGFSDRLVDLPITPRQRLDDVISTMDRLPFGRTDCAQPMLHAAANGLNVDVFHVYTDNETWCGNIHPHQALGAYRAKNGINSKLAVIAFSATNFSIADPSDARELDFVGFDAAAPQVLADFGRERSLVAFEG